MVGDNERLKSWENPHALNEKRLSRIEREHMGLKLFDDNE